VHPKKLEAVTKLDGPERYGYFVRKVADGEVAWGLESAGWAAGEDDSGRLAFVTWPEREFAELCATDSWSHYVAKELELDHLLRVFLPGLQRDGSLVAVFPTPTNKAVFVEPARLIEDLRLELEQYEDA
jgi:hypothetical protein